MHISHGEIEGDTLFYTCTGCKSGGRPLCSARGPDLALHQTFGREPLTGFLTEEPRSWFPSQWNVRRRQKRRNASEVCFRRVVLVDERHYFVSRWQYKQHVIAWLQ